MPVSVTELPADEILRYMGCPPEKADAATRALAEDCAGEVLRVMSPRWTYRVLPLDFVPGGVRLGELLLPGASLKRHLAGCGRAVLLAATLGAGTDALIRRAERADLARALALDCAAAAAVEALCDGAERELRSLFPGCSFPYRYSPGYGDLPLTVQGELLALLDAPRRLGLTAAPSSILLPRKSVTAILGVSQGPVEARERSCLGCAAYGGCSYRKSGGHCGIS